MRLLNSTYRLIAIGCLLGPLLCSAEKPAISSDVSWVSFEVPGAFETIPSAMNNSMVVTGTYTLPSEYLGGFIRSADGVLTTFTVPNSSNTVPVAMNEKGDIAGYYDEGRTVVGFLRKADGTIETFSPDPKGMAYVTGINEDGTIVGYFYCPGDTNRAHAFIRRADGEIIRFHIPGSEQTLPEGIDADGEITGFYQTTPGTADYAGFVRSCHGAIHTFAVPGNSETVPASINAHGTIVGTLSSSDANDGFLRFADGKITRFDIPGAAILPQSINASGEVSGYFYYPSPEFSYQAFLRSNTGAFTVFNFPAGTDTDAITINNSGVIAGDYSNGYGVQSFLRIPSTQ